MSSAPHFEVGSFAMNCWGGLSHTLEPRWNASWPNAKHAVRLAEDAGFDFILPITHWQGHKGDCPTDGHTLETLTWAAAVLAITDRIRVYATVNSQFIHPVWAAKQAVTCNDIGEGRFGGLNIVSGYSASDFDAFGVEMLPHDERYDYTAEWASIVKRLWRETEPFDFDGKYFHLKNTQLLPPSRDPVPAIINAGNSPNGKAFSARQADVWFTMLYRNEKGFQGLAEELSEFREMAGRDINIYASGHIICRETEEETDAYYQSIIKRSDWGAFNHWKQAMSSGSQSISEAELEAVGVRFITGMSTCLFRGTPEEIVEEFCVLRDAGLNGIALAMQDYIEDVPIIRDKLLPLMAQNGLRRVDTPIAGGKKGTLIDQH